MNRRKTDNAAKMIVESVWNGEQTFTRAALELSDLTGWTVEQALKWLESEINYLKFHEKANTKMNGVSKEYKSGYGIGRKYVKQGKLTGKTYDEIDAIAWKLANENWYYDRNDIIDFAQGFLSGALSFSKNGVETMNGLHLVKNGYVDDVKKSVQLNDRDKMSDYLAKISPSFQIGDVVLILWRGKSFLWQKYSHNGWSKVRDTKQNGVRNSSDNDIEYRLLKLFHKIYGKDFSNGVPSYSLLPHELQLISNNPSFFMSYNSDGGQWIALKDKAIQAYLKNSKRNGTRRNSGLRSNGIGRGMPSKSSLFIVYVKLDHNENKRLYIANASSLYRNDADEILFQGNRKDAVNFYDEEIESARYANSTAYGNNVRRNSTELEIGGREVVFVDENELIVELPSDELEQLEDLNENTFIEDGETFINTEYDSDFENMMLENQYQLSNEDYEEFEATQNGYEKGFATGLDAITNLDILFLHGRVNKEEYIRRLQILLYDKHISQSEYNKALKSIRLATSNGKPNGARTANGKTKAAKYAFHENVYSYWNTDKPARIASITYDDYGKFWKYLLRNEDGQRWVNEKSVSKRKVRNGATGAGNGIKQTLTQALKQNGITARVVVRRNGVLAVSANRKTHGFKQSKGEETGAFLAAVVENLLSVPNGANIPQASKYMTWTNPKTGEKVTVLFTGTHAKVKYAGSLYSDWLDVENGLIHHSRATIPVNELRRNGTPKKKRVKTA